MADTHVKGIHFLMKKNKVTEYDGRGSFVDAHTIDVAKADGSHEQVTFDNAIISTGSKVRLLPGVTLSDNIVTYEEQILTRDLPKSIVIVGAGAIGMEFGFVMVNYGVKVTIIEFLDRALPNEDADVSKEIARQYKKYGVDILTSTKVETRRRPGRQGHRHLHAARTASRPRSRPTRCSCRSASRRTSRATGSRTPASSSPTAARSTSTTTCAPTCPHIYAIGDVTAKLQLAHVAEAQGVVAAETIGKAETMTLGDYRMMPRATFCSPQVASFGLTEQQARDDGYDVKVAKFPFSANGKANGLGEPIGFVKLIADGEHLELLGGHLIGPDVSELLPELTLAQKWDLTALEAARNVHTHPTLSEAVQEAFHGLAGHMINL